MKRVRMSVVTVLVLVVALLFTSCGSQPATNANAGDSSQPAGSSQPAAGTPAEGSALKGDLTYWSMWNETEPQAAVIKDAAAEFMKNNPDVKITMQWNGRDIRKTLKPALDAGQKIDFWDEDTERIVKSYQDYSLKLDSYYEKAYPSTDGKPYKDVIMGSIVNLAKSFSTDGGIYAVPYQPMVLSLLYNKDLYEKAGVTSAPKTWDEFLTVCEKLKASGVVPLTIDDFFMDLPFGYYLARLKGVDWVAQLVKDKSGAMWDDPAVAQAAKAYEELAAKGYFSPNVASNKWPTGQQDLGTGTVATYFLIGTWLPNELLPVTGPDFKWGAFAFPEVPGAVGGINDNIYGAQGFQIHKDCKSPDAAFTFLASLTSGKWDKELSVKTIGAPMGKDTEWPTQLSDQKVMFDNMKSSYPWSCGLAEDTEVLPVVIAEFTKLISGQIKADAFIANVKAKAKRE